MCDVCNGKRYLICERTEDGRKAVERCDACSWWGENDPRTLWDEDAAKLAQADGIACAPTYPCYLTEA
ncbi:MAG: hypothetical protein J2P55_00055 [Rhizobiales bacterium]|nr:hypothetical protein [Hyphomicrobiales bacterium]